VLEEFLVCGELTERWLAMNETTAGALFTVIYERVPFISFVIFSAYVYKVNSD
jgi:hypothetical protein